MAFLGPFLAGKRTTEMYRNSEALPPPKGGNPMQTPQDRYQAQALLPTITSTVLVTLFFGLFGLIPAVGNSNKARALGVPTNKYWKAFWVTFGIGLVAWIIIITAAAAGSSPSTGAFGHRYGWQQPHNPHHPVCVSQPVIVDPPPCLPYPVPPPVPFRP